MAYPSEKWTNILILTFLLVPILRLMFSGVKGLARHGLFYAAIKFRISAIILIDVDHN